MKKQKVKRFWATLLAIGVVITTVFPGTAYADEIGTQISEPVKVEEQSDLVEDGEEQTDSEVKPAGDSNILLLSSETVPEDTLGAVAVEQLAGAVRLTYESAEMSKNAFDVFTAMGIVCEYDIQVEMLDKEPEKVEELNPTEVPTEDVAVVEELNEEPVAVESASKEKSVKVAVVDTGCDLNVISGRIADGTDMSVADVNGHGTLVAEIIASQTTEKVKILPIKAFDDNGYSTVGQVYDAIMRAIDSGVDVINLSMSGAGTSQMLTYAINKATEKGIIVVVSAGNDASDVEGFMPGNIDSAITVSATDRNEVFTEYSNFGEKIDYSAVGEIIKDQGTEDTSDDVYYNGTSIAAAFVSSYAACVKDNNPEADILGTFDKYAKDLGEAGRDNYYGRGFLALENISFDVNKKESVSDEAKKEDDSQKGEKENGDKSSDESQKDKDQILETSDWSSLAGGGTLTTSTTINLSGNVSVTGAGQTKVGNDTNKITLTVNGNGHTITNNMTSVPRGGSGLGIFYVSPGSTLVLNNVKINCNGSADANSILSQRGGASGDGTSIIKIKNCSFKNAGINAQHILSFATNTTIEDSTFNGASGISIALNGQKATVKNCSVQNASNIGIQVATSASTTIQDSTIKNCGNGLYVFSNCTIKNNSIHDNTNGITNVGGSTTIEGSEMEIYKNSSGLLVHGGTVTINRCLVYSNTEGIANGSSVNIYRADIYDNQNGIRNIGTMNLTPTKGNIRIGKRTDGNTASTKTHPNKIGIYNFGTLTLQDNATTDDNEVVVCWNSQYGFYNSGSGKATIKNVDVYNNGILKTKYDKTTAKDECVYNTTNTCAGIRNEGSGTVNLTNTQIRANQGAGIRTSDGVTTNITNSNVYGNIGYGVSNKGNLTINSGNFYSNTNSGVVNSGAAEPVLDEKGNFKKTSSNNIKLTSDGLTIKNGTFHDNGKSGVYNSGRATIEAGSFYSNKDNGVYNSGTPENVVNKAGKTGKNADGSVATNKKGMTIKGGSFCRNTNHGAESVGKLKIENGSFYGSINASGVNSTGTLTVNGGAYYSNKSHGIAVGGGTANIYYGTFGTYSNDSGKTWVNVGNASAGIRTKKATTNVYGGVFFYNKNGLECQDGALNLKYDGTNKRIIYVSDNTSNGLCSKGEVKNANGSVNTAGGNIVIDSNAKVDAHSNKSAAIYTGNKAKVSTGAGSYYNSPYGINVASGGTVTLSGGDVYGNKTYGVYNNGTFTMSGGKVRDNDSNGTAVGGSKVQGIYNKSGIVNISGGQLSGNSDGLYNLSTANVTGGTIKGNGNGIRNNTDPTTGISGTTKVDGTNVNITGNTRGIQNTADENGVKVIKATITGNTTADLSQSGKTFTISGANTKADTIELGVKNLGNNKYVCEVVTIDGVPTETKKVEIRQALDGNNFNAEMADMNITIGRPMFKCINTTPKAVLDSKKLVFADGKQITLVKDKEEKAIMRPFEGSNMNESLAGGNIAEKDKYIVLSTKYAGIYKVNEVLDGVEFTIPDPADIFWNEDNHIKMPELWATIGGIFKKFDIIGWLKDGEGNPVSVNSIMTFLFGESNRDHEIVAKLGAVNLYVNGNGQSDGEDYVIEEFNCTTDTLPENTFEKEFLDDYYYIELGEQKRHETKYSYQGWSLSDDATYQSEGVMQPKGKLDYADVLTYIDSHKDSITYGDNGLPNIPLYVVWDKYPELQAKDVAIVTGWVDESYSFVKTDEELQKIIYEGALGTDDEDGTLTNGVEEKGVICIDFDKEEIKQFKHTGTATLTYRATDGVGNVTERKVHLYINSSDPYDTLDLNHPEKGGAYPNRARCINRKTYDAGKVSVGLESTDKHYLDGYRAGGLMPTDLWYTNPGYAAVIERAFDNLENDTPEFVWTYTHEQVLETQKYIEDHGFGDALEKGSLHKYYEKYKGNITKNNISVCGKGGQHEYEEATCETARKCKKCDLEDGLPNGHQYRAATCTEAKKCIVCGKTFGEALGHNYVDDKCIRCGERK